jgi:hypothetical protein
MKFSFFEYLVYQQHRSCDIGLFARNTIRHYYHGVKPVENIIGMSWEEFVHRYGGTAKNLEVLELVRDELTKICYLNEKIMVEDLSK